MPMGTGRPCLLAAHKNREVKIGHGLGSLELWFVLATFGEWEMLKMVI